jgi:hypothetical protein
MKKLILLLSLVFSACGTDSIIIIRELEYSAQSVRPCPEAVEILIRTDLGLARQTLHGYLQKHIISASLEVPGYLECIHPIFLGNSGKVQCLAFQRIPEYSAEFEHVITVFTLEYSYLAILEDGIYETNDGTGCIFEIEGGNIVSL